MPRRYGLRSVNWEEFLISGCADAVNGQAARVQDTRAVFRDDCVASAFLCGHLCDHGELSLPPVSTRATGHSVRLQRYRTSPCDPRGGAAVCWPVRRVRGILRARTSESSILRFSLKRRLSAPADRCKS